MIGKIKIAMLKGEKGDTGATGDYSGILNKPSINGVELDGNKTASELGLATGDEQQNLHETVVGLNNAVDAIETNITNIDGDIADMGSDITALQSSVDTLTVNAPESFAVDMWDCTRFPDMKTFMASAIVSVTPQGSTAQGSMFYSETISLPLPFECVSGSVAVSGTADNLHMIANAQATTTTLSFRLVRGESIQTSALSIRLIIMGRYA